MAARGESPTSADVIQGGGSRGARVGRVLDARLLPVTWGDGGEGDVEGISL